MRKIQVNKTTNQGSEKRTVATNKVKRRNSGLDKQ